MEEGMAPTLFDAINVNSAIVVRDVTNSGNGPVNGTYEIHKCTKFVNCTMELGSEPVIYGIFPKSRSVNVSRLPIDEGNVPDNDVVPITSACRFVKEPSEEL